VASGLALLCAGAASGAAPKRHPAPKVGLLRVVISGLPRSVPAAVTVVGPDRFRVRLTKTATFGLKPGRYATAAARVSAGRLVYVAAVGTKVVYLTRRMHRSVAVTYARLKPATTPTASGGSRVGGLPQGGAATTTPGAGSGGGGGGSGSGGSTGAVHMYLGYADLYRATGAAVPSPWDGSQGVTFVGCGSPLVDDPGAPCNTTSNGRNDYDAGAIRLDNGSSVPVTVSAASVEIGRCTYTPWQGLKVTIEPGNTLILTQTGGSNACADKVGYNFDTSESNASCTSRELIPVIALSLNGTPTTVADTGQILNTGGADTGECGPSPNEYHPWVEVT